MERVTKSDLTQWKNEVIQEVRDLINDKLFQPGNWVKTDQAMEILGCSRGTLQTLSQNGTLACSKLGGTNYYSTKSILKAMERNMHHEA